MPELSIVLVHANAPPVPGGTNVVLARLFGAMRETRLAVYTDLAWRRRVRRGGALLLDGRYGYFLRLGAVAQRLVRLRGLADVLDVGIALIAGLRVAAGVRRLGPPDLFVAPLDAGFSTIATALAARLTRRPYLIMVFDLWEENAYSPIARRIARRVERRILCGAASVVAFSDRVSDHYERKHGLPCELIDTPIAATDSPTGTPASNERPLEILVGGAIYWAQEDAVRRLLRVARGFPDVTVTIVGDESDLRARGFHADAYEARLDGSEFQARLQRAGAVFVGLSLESPYPEVVNTATPARLPEAMASGRPLLVHAPAESHAAIYARGHDFAEVVDRPDDHALESGIRALLERPDRAERRTRTALRLVRERHDIAVVAPAYEAILRRAAESGA